MRSSLWGARKFADGVDAVAFAGPAAVLLPGEAPTQVGEVALGELDDVETVQDHRRVRQGAVDGGAEGGTQVNGAVADPLAPDGGLGAESVGGRRRVALRCVTERLGPGWQVATVDYRLRKPAYVPVDLTYSARVTDDDGSMTLELIEDHPSGEVGFEGALTVTPTEEF